MLTGAACRCGASFSDVSSLAQQAARDVDGAWKGADALVIDAGEADEDRLYSKSQAIQTWLLGWEFPETVIVICSRSVHILSSKKKGSRSPFAHTVVRCF